MGLRRRSAWRNKSAQALGGGRDSFDSDERFAQKCILNSLSDRRSRGRRGARAAERAGARSVVLVVMGGH